MNHIADIMTYAFIVAGILVATKPGGQGPAIVTQTANGFAHIVQAASGQQLTKL